MTSRDFCYWLQGYLEISAANQVPVDLKHLQIDCIQKHLALVFKHEIDPSYGPESHQEELRKIHNTRFLDGPFNC